LLIKPKNKSKRFNLSSSYNSVLKTQNMNHFESQQIYLFDQQVFVQKYII